MKLTIQSYLHQTPAIQAAYIVKDNNGDTATAIISLDIRCSKCVVNQPEPGYQILLSWTPSAGSIDGYNIYFGKSADTATYKISTTPRTEKYFYILEDLQAFPGDKVCFIIKSYNFSGLSGFSKATCTVIESNKARTISLFLKTSALKSIQQHPS